MNLPELDTLLERQRQESLDEESYPKLQSLLKAFRYLVEQIGEKDATISRPRALLMKPSTEKTDKVLERVGIILLRGQASREVVVWTRSPYSGQPAIARSIALKYLEAHPQDSSALILLARAEIAQGQYQPAYKALRKAWELDPSNLDVLYYLERLCAILSQGEFQRLLETPPDSYRAHQLLAESYLARHDKENPERDYQAALKANPQSVDVLDALGDLRRKEYKLLVGRAVIDRCW